MAALLAGIVLFLFLIGYLIVFPLSKKRPILLKEKGFAFFAVSLILIIMSYSVLISIVLIVTVVVILLAIRSWLIFGIKKKFVFEALEKASLITRATCETTGNVIKVDKSMKVRTISFSRKMHICIFRIKNNRSKMKITRTVFKKFIMNNFINN
ncbi:MAG: hypothetical protein ACOCUF_00890 [Patescibacteria group bacterium]